MRVLVALDKFKDALSSAAACRTVAHAIKSVQPTWQVDICPLTDGGEGFEEIIGNAVGAERIQLEVTAPLGGLTSAAISVVSLDRFPASARTFLHAVRPLEPSARVAIVEMAQASGLSLVPPDRRDPRSSTTHGVGQLLRAAAEMGARAIVLGVGGSATIDLGLGALSALGLEFRDSNGAKLRPPLPRHWPDLTAIEGDVFPSIPPILIAADVTNPLLGPNGAVAQYGPQKGLPPGDVERMDGLAQIVAQKLCAHCGQPFERVDESGAGAAGGIAFGLRCAARAQMISGATFVANSIGLERRIDEADIVITGEGRFDSTSLAGKGPGTLLTLARARGKIAHVFAGQITLPSGDDAVRLHALSEGEVTREMLANTRSTLARAVEETFR